MIQQRCKGETSPVRRAGVMEQESPSRLSRSTSLPSRASPAIATDPFSSITRPPSAISTGPSASITRPYRLSPSTSKGFAPSAAKPSALLHRRAHAAQGLSEVKASHLEGDPPPPPPSPLRPPPPAPSSSPPSAYEVLHVPPSASQQEIKSAYWRLARQHHPDKVPLDRKEASSILFQQIYTAYTILKDPEARSRYDLQMSLQSSQSVSADLKTPRFCSPSPNVFTPRSQPYTPKPYPYTPRSQLYTAKGAAGGDSTPNVITPRTPFSGGRSWESDQCW